MGEDKIIVEFTNEGLPDGYFWFPNQVAGHHPSVVKNGKREIGFIKTNSSEVFKPQHEGKLGENEVGFYELLKSNQHLMNSSFSFTTDLQGLCAFTPKFFGVVPLTINGERINFLKLEDVTSSYYQPAVLDIKMGRVTAGPDSDAERVARKARNYPTQFALGFRVLGYKIQKAGVLEEKNKDWGKLLDESSVEEGLLEFFSGRSNGVVDVLKSAIEKLETIKNFFETQTSFHFFASSLLFLYEADEKLPVNMKIVFLDFPHVFDAKGTRDENVLFGVKKLNGYLEQLLAAQEAKNMA